MMNIDVIEQLKKISGNVGFYYKNLVSDEIIQYQSDQRFEAASVIKIPIMIELYHQFESGNIKKEEVVVIKEEDKLPSCGALTYLHNNIEVTMKDLCTLMIILSDNTATNLLIKRLGMDNINYRLRTLGCTNTTINRLLFDSAQSALGIQNYIVPQEIGQLLEGLYRKEIISVNASEEMLSILMNQRLNGKIPFYITDGTKVAHKTGEDDGITHDVGIVFTKQPFIICFCSNEVNVPEFERMIQTISFQFIQKNQ